MRSLLRSSFVSAALVALTAVSAPCQAAPRLTGELA